MFDFPGIYEEADNISNNTQRMYLLVLKSFLGLLVLSSVAFSYFNDIREIKIINAIISIAILVLSFVFYLYNFQGIWYNARAVAESIKTVCWRYAVKAEPYNIDDSDAKKIVLETIQKIIQMNHEFQKHISADYSSHDQVPESMVKIRSLSLVERKEYYHINRVIEQRDWYIKKSRMNKRKSSIFFMLLICVSIILSILLFISIDDTRTVFPIEIALSLLSIIFTWVQTKKYRELDKSYALASHEIGFIAKIMDGISTENELSEYVNDSENAFSREHTQWIARKDK